VAIKRYDVDNPHVHFIELAAGDYCLWVEVYDELERYRKLLNEIRSEIGSYRPYAVILARIESLLEKGPK